MRLLRGCSKYWTRAWQPRSRLYRSSCTLVFVPAASRTPWQEHRQNSVSATAPKGLLRYSAQRATGPCLTIIREEGVWEFFTRVKRGDALLEYPSVALIQNYSNATIYRPLALTKKCFPL
ncbi:hypothetical protein TRVL_08666 [Trypanosoma vivax]|nr:hypothetical protein TRVL_08666 [Trypanosoma vivax]